MDEIILDFNKIFKNEEIIKKDKYKTFGKELTNYLNEHDEVLLIINSHGDEEQEQEPTIHYNNQYWGNKEFNELLEKYKLCFEWYDKNIGFIYKNL